MLDPGPASARGVVAWVAETGYPPFRVLTRDGSQHLTMRT